MIIKDQVLGLIHDGVQDTVIDGVVDTPSDLPAQDAIPDFNIVSPSTMHTVEDSNNWMMNSQGAWFKQKSGGGGGGLDPDDYYTTTEIDLMLENYYTSSQVDALLPDMTDYYTKTEVDNLLPDMTDYYTKTQVDNLLPDMTDYYTKTEIDTTLDDYYTSTETDTAITTALGGYYTSSQVDSAIATALNGYYTSTQVDTLLGSYYTSAQTDSAISSYWTTNIANYYTKTQVDALIPTIPSTYDADDINYDNTTSGLTATNVQDAIDELAAGSGGGGGGGGAGTVTIGKNKLRPMLNSLTLFSSGSGTSQQYVTLTPNSDGTITYSWKNVNADALFLWQTGAVLWKDIVLKPNTEYIISGFTSGPPFKIEVYERNGTTVNGTLLTTAYQNSEATFTTGSVGVVSIYFRLNSRSWQYSGTSTSTFSPMIRESSENSTFEPFYATSSGATVLYGSSTQASTTKGIASILTNGYYLLKDYWIDAYNSTTNHSGDFHNGTMLIVEELPDGSVLQKKREFSQAQGIKMYYRLLNSQSRAFNPTSLNNNSDNELTWIEIS